MTRESHRLPMSTYGAALVCGTSWIPLYLLFHAIRKIMAVDPDYYVAEGTRAAVLIGVLSVLAAIAMCIRCAKSRKYSEVSIILATESILLLCCAVSATIIQVMVVLPML